MVKYIELKENERATHIRVELYYRKDGTDRTPRGYYLNVLPVTREKRHGVMMESYDAFSGSTRLIMAVKRKSARSEQEAQERADLVEDVMIARVCSQQGLEVE